MFKPTDAMAEEAQRGLDWRREYGRGGTEIGIARARDIVNGRNLSASTVKRMYSFFSRHEVDKQAEGFSPGEDGYPSNGRIAWALWGGDAGYSWSREIADDLDDEDQEDDDMDDRAAPDALKVGDFVEWNSSGGMARGQIEHVMLEGTLGIPDSEFSIDATPEDPAALIRIFRDGEATETLVGHRFSTLTKIRPIRSLTEMRPYPNEHAARIRDPRQYDRFRRENDAGGNGVDFIYGIKGGDSEIQAIRFDKEIYTVAEARAWLRRNSFEPIDFEPAIGSEDRAMQDGAESAMIDAEHEATEMTEEDHIDADTRYSREKIETRAMAMDEAVIDGDSRRVKIAVSSEEPVERSFGMEVLDHSEGSIDLSFLKSGRAPLLLDHDPTKQIGVVESVSLDGSARRLRATVRFGRNGLAKEVFDDVTDGIRANISVGYQINKLSKDGEKAYRAVSWMPMEVSVVSIPADRTVGVGRAAGDDLTTIIVEPQIKEARMAELDLDAVKAEAARTAAKETAEMYRLAGKHNKRDLADKAIADGRSLAEFRGMLLDAIGDRPLETSEIGLNQKEVRRFSLMNAIRAMANPTDRRAQEDAAFEFEASAAAQRLLGLEARGLMVPSDVLRSWGKRDINTTDDSGLIAQDFRGGDFIDVLRNASSVMQAGATMLTGLKGNVAIPKKTAASTAGWISTEGGASSESEPTFGQVTMTPRTLGAFTDITRLMMMQSSPDIEALIRNDLSTGIALAIDDGALEGSGSSGQPTGIKNTSGVNKPTSFAAATPTFAEVVALETAVAEDNALLGNLSYILPASMYGALKTTVKVTGQAQFVVEPGGTINGYRAIVSNQVTSGDLYFGNFSDLLIGMYGGLDITVDPYTSSNTGTVRIVALQTVDVAVRHAVSFAYNNDGV
jgi:HK97 family phage major capsid protein